MNEEERAKLNELWDEAKEKKNRTEAEKMRFYWKVKDMKLRKWYIRKEKSGEVKHISGGGRRELKVAYTNVNVTALLKLNDYISENKPDIMGITETKLYKGITVNEYW